LKKSAKNGPIKEWQVGPVLRPFSIVASLDAAVGPWKAADGCAMDRVGYRQMRTVVGSPGTIVRPLPGRAFDFEGCGILAGQRSGRPVAILRGGMSPLGEVHAVAPKVDTSNSTRADRRIRGLPITLMPPDVTSGSTESVPGLVGRVHCVNVSQMTRFVTEA
jgi:hypothetical protein